MEWVIEKCLRNPERSEIRKVYFFIGRSKQALETCLAKMKRKIETNESRLIYNSELELWNIAARKFDQIDSIENPEDLRIPPVNRLKLLSGDRKRQYSIRINEQNRIYFQWSDQEPTEVEFADYH